MGKYEQVKRWLDQAPLDIEPGKERQLTEFLYTASEIGFFDAGNIDIDDGLLIYKAMQRILKEGFPRELRM